jgi:ADP-ribose pyrophosphatase YjhB (NUDIX family)
MSESWVHWARELLTMSQTGLTYSTDSFDVVRYNRIREIALAMLASGSGTELASVARIFAAEKGHATPKLDVRAFVLKEGRVLLVRERSDGLWSLPGGWADVGESPSEAIAREVREESGYEVRITRLLALYDRERHNHPPHPLYAYKLFFLGELTGGTAQTSDETDAVGFFPRDELPALSLDRIVPAQLMRLFELANDPRSPADFD